jgi:hypothetical protein
MRLGPSIYLIEPISSFRLIEPHFVAIVNLIEDFRFPQTATGWKQEVADVE